MKKVTYVHEVIKDNVKKLEKFIKLRKNRMSTLVFLKFETYIFIGFIKILEILLDFLFLFFKIILFSN